jgi:hypothetical protein
MFTNNTHEMIWSFHFLDHGTKVNKNLLHQCNVVCADGFGGSLRDWEESNKEKLSSSTIFGILADGQGGIYGIAYYFIPDDLIFDSHLIWEEGICLMHSVQGQGYAKKAVEKAISLFPDFKFQWLCCTTQNPSMFIRYSKYGKKLFPFDESYETSEGKSIMDFLCKHMKNLRTIDRNTLNVGNGICKSFYGHGRLGNYLINLPGAERFNKKLQEWGFQRESGDAIIMALNLQ